jgi:hypothetical protein
VERLSFGNCLLPCFSLSSPIRACTALRSFTCSWGRGPHYHRLRFLDLHQALLSQKDSLERLILDASHVLYWDWDTFDLDNAIPTEAEKRDRSPLGSLHDFNKLTYLEISGVILTRVEPISIQVLADILPPNLETLVLLDPIPNKPDFWGSMNYLAQNCVKCAPKLETINIQHLNFGRNHRIADFMSHVFSHVGVEVVVK